MPDQPNSEAGLPLSVFKARIRDALEQGLIPAVNYAARSRQDKRGSIPDQLRENREKAEAEGYAIIATFSDDGFSAYSGNRGPDLAAALDVVKIMGEMTYKPGLPVEAWPALWCNDPDRLARGAGDRPLATKALTEVWHEVRRQGVRLRAVYDDDDLVDEAAVGEKSKRSRKYSETLARRTAQGKARRVKERKQSIAPTLYWGYMRDDGGKEVPDPERWVAAQRIWELGLAGRGPAEIQQALREEDLPSPPARRISDILRSKYYAGFVNLHGEWTPGEQPAMVPLEQFELIQQPVRRRPGRHAHKYLLSKMLRCFYCRAMMNVHSVDGQYICSTKGCGQKPLLREEADGAVIAYFENLGFDRESTLADLRARADRHVDQAQQILGVAQRSRGKLDEEQARMWTMLRSGDISPANWNQFEAEYEQETAALDAQITQFTTNLKRAHATTKVNELEGVVVERLGAIRKAAAGIASAGDALAVQGAIRRLFKEFVLGPDEGVVAADLWLPQTRRKLWPVVNAAAFQGALSNAHPILTRTTVDLVGSPGEDEEGPAGISALSA